MVAQVLIPSNGALRQKSETPARIDHGCKLCDISCMNFLNLSSPAATAFVLCCDRALGESDT